jgi:hypothetical protein
MPSDYQKIDSKLFLQRIGLQKASDKYDDRLQLSGISSSEKSYCQKQIYVIETERLPQVRKEKYALDDNQPITQVPSETRLLELQEATRAVHSFNVEAQAIEDLTKLVANLVSDLGANSRAGSDQALLSSKDQLPHSLLLGTSFSAFESSEIVQGSYTGALPEMVVDLRIDNSSRIISADLFRLDPAAQKTWVAAFRTVPGNFANSGGPIVATDRYGAVSNGSISIISVDELNIQVTMRFGQALDGLPFGRNIVFIARFVDNSLRELGIEMELEDQVPPPPTTSFDGKPMSIHAAFHNAGIAVTSVGNVSELPKPPAEGWSEKDLEELMFNAAQAPFEHPEFAVHLLWLSKSNRPGLLGVMFDTSDDLPRQGLAVFANEIADYVPADVLPRKLIQTAVHEIGHALNLAHRFEREVGRADSTSFMNYDWRYAGGNKAETFWQKFAYTFDEDELMFLRHAPYRQTVPGGAPFHSVRYWSDGNGGYSPYLPEQPLPGYKLDLFGPPQLVFEFGQPVLLGIRLTNQTGRKINVPTSILDPKAGLVEVLIRKVLPGRTPVGAPESFVPITTRCFDISGDGFLQLENNQSHEDNLQLAFGAAGFPFAEPGLYEITAALAFSDSRRGIDYLAPSNTLKIRVAYPESREAERIAHEVLFRPDVGRWFALGAPRRLSDARESVLREIDKAKGKHVPIVANIARTAMFGFAREKDHEEAKRLADKVAPLLENTFDSVTVKQTQAFIKRNFHGK